MRARGASPPVAPEEFDDEENTGVIRDMMEQVRAAARSGAHDLREVAEQRLRKQIESEPPKK